MNYSQAESTQQTHDSNGIQYIFAYNDTEEGWIFPRHRFQINTSEITSGDFISSMWYSSVSSLNENLEFLVLGIKGNFDYSKVTSLVNGSYISYGKNILSDYEKSAGIYFKDYYCYTAKQCSELFNNVKSIDGHSDLSLVGCNEYSTLYIKVMSMDGGIYNTTPSFQLADTNLSALMEGNNVSSQKYVFGAGTGGTTMTHNVGSDREGKSGGTVK